MSSLSHCHYPNFEPNFRFRFREGSVQVQKKFKLGSNSFFIQKAGIQWKYTTTLKKTSNFDTGIRSKSISTRRIELDTFLYKTDDRLVDATKSTQ